MVRRHIRFLFSRERIRFTGSAGDTPMRGAGARGLVEVLLETVCGSESAGDSRTAVIHIRFLRAKSERDPADARHIISVRDVGYRFEEETKMRAGGRHAVTRT